MYLENGLFGVNTRELCCCWRRTGPVTIQTFEFSFMFLPSGSLLPRVKIIIIIVIIIKEISRQHDEVTLKTTMMMMCQHVRVADLPGRRRLRSSSSHRLHVPAYRLATAGRRSFPVAASILWNSLPPDIQSSTSFTDFWLNCSTNHFQTSCLNRSHIDFASVDFVMSPAYYNLATLTIPIDLMMGV